MSGPPDVPGISCQKLCLFLVAFPFLISVQRCCIDRETLSPEPVGTIKSTVKATRAPGALLEPPPDLLHKVVIFFFLYPTQPPLPDKMSGVGVGSGKGASVREKNITTPRSDDHTLFCQNLDAPSPGLF